MEVAMVTDGRVKELRRLLGMGRTLADSARMAEMSEKTARTYRDDKGLPSQQKTGRVGEDGVGYWAVALGPALARRRLNSFTKTCTLVPFTTTSRHWSLMLTSWKRYSARRIQRRNRRKSKSRSLSDFESIIHDPRSRALAKRLEDRLEDLKKPPRTGPFGQR
jgi:hypothetical protein